MIYTRAAFEGDVELAVTEPSTTLDSRAPRRAASASKAAAPVLSRRFKDAFKLALSMVIATGIALSMDWEKPYWAALAVFMCSFSASGDSLNKGLLRIAGTLAAVVVTLALVALAAQDRWLFLTLVTGWILLCGYMLTGTTKGYFWMCAGFTVPILAMSGGVHAPATFATVVLRAQETGLGVIVYSLVSFLIWPASSSGPFRAAIGAVVDLKRRTAGYLLELMAGREDDATADEFRARAAPILGRLPAMLDGAEKDSDAIRSRRDAWRRVVADLVALREALERWYSSLGDVRALDLKTLLPGLAAFGAEIDRRLLAVEGLLQGQAPEIEAPEIEPAVVDAGFDPARLVALAPFDRAALVSCTDQMGRVERRTASLLNNAAAALNLRDIPDRAVPAVAAAAPAPVFDPDRFFYALRPFFAVWTASLLAIYLPGLPNPSIIVALSNSLCLALALMPQVPPTVAQGAAVRALIVTGALYMLVLPRLSGFGGLAVLLFAAVFAIGYRFPADTAPVDRPIWLAVLVLCLGVSNEQAYSFLHWANLMLPLVLAIWLVTLIGFFPISYQPRDRYGRLLRRFFRSCRFLVSDTRWDHEPEPSRVSDYRARFHMSEVARIPSKMLPFCGPVQARIGSDAQPTAPAVVATLQGLRRRLVDVCEARAEIGSAARALPEGLRGELREWRVALYELFDQLSADPEALHDVDLAGGLDAKVRHLEASVEAVLNAGDGERHSTPDALRLYHLLAALRDISSSLVRFADQAKAFPWSRFRESRF